MLIKILKLFIYIKFVKLSGCGRHKELIMSEIPEDERCECKSKKSKCTIL